MFLKTINHMEKMHPCNVKQKQRDTWDRLSGTGVKFTRSASKAWGLWIRIPGMDLHTTHQAMLWWCPTYKIEEDFTDVSSATMFLKHRGSLATDVSSGSNFLTKKKKERKEKSTILT